MATLSQNAAEVASCATAIDAAIVAKGATTAGGLRNAAAAIATISTGATTTPLSVTANGTYTAPAGTAYTPVNVAVADPTINQDATQIYTTIPNGGLDFKFIFLWNSNVTIDWGDGSAAETFTTDVWINATHHYAAGSYVITLTTTNSTLDTAAVGSNDGRNMFCNDVATTSSVTKIVHGNKAIFGLETGCGENVNIPFFGEIVCSQGATLHDKGFSFSNIRRPTLHSSVVAKITKIYTVNYYGDIRKIAISSLYNDNLICRNMYYLNEIDATGRDLYTDGFLDCPLLEVVKANKVYIGNTPAFNLNSLVSYPPVDSTTSGKGLGWHYFHNTKLTELTLCENISGAWNQTFRCDAAYRLLKTLNIRSLTPPTLTGGYIELSTAFDSSDHMIYVQNATVADLYRIAPGWSYYATCIGVEGESATRGANPDRVATFDANDAVNGGSAYTCSSAESATTVSWPESAKANWTSTQISAVEALMTSKNYTVTWVSGF